MQGLSKCLKLTSTKNLSLPTALLEISIPDSPQGLVIPKALWIKAMDALQLQLAKTWIIFWEGRAGFQKRPHSEEMSHTKIKPLMPFEGKGTAGDFWGKINQTKPKQTFSRLGSLCVLGELCPAGQGRIWRDGC